MGVMAWWDKVRSGWDEAQHRLASASRDAQDRWQAAQKSAQTSAEHWVKLFVQAQQSASDPRALSHALAEALRSTQRQLDRHAPAVSVGAFRQAGAGVSVADGIKLTYVRPDGPVRGQIRISDLFGRLAHLSVGVGAAGFAACLYGPRSALLEPGRWRGGDAGIWVASVGLFTATSAGTKHTRVAPRAAGWMVGLGVGVGLGLPIISDLGAFELEERVNQSFPLATSDSQALETILAEAPDCRVRRTIAQRLTS
ncbi:MAG: hypothetical protein ACFB9M_13780 [Myxococcota bacterium]